MDKVRIQHISSTIQHIMEEGKIQPIFPLNPVYVANALGYQVFYLAKEQTQQDISGAIDKANKRIFVNPYDTLERQTFTIAHEIGHAVLHQNSVVDFRNNTNLSSTQIKQEEEADEFAAQLLMPEERFVEEWKKFYSISHLKACFAVSDSAIMLRAKKLGLIHAY